MYLILAGALIIAIILWDWHRGTERHTEAPNTVDTLPNVHPRPIKPQAVRMGWVEQAQADHILRLNENDPNNVERNTA